MTALNKWKETGALHKYIGMEEWECKIISTESFIDYFGTLPLVLLAFSYVYWLYFRGRLKWREWRPVAKKIR